MKRRSKTEFKTSKINWTVLIASIIVVFLVAFAGSFFTSAGSDTEWYDSIKPDITPPGWVFPVVWNILYFFIALSFYFAWTSTKDKNLKINLVALFGINLLLNVLWSYLFFTLQNPPIAFIGLLLIWITIVFMMIFTKRLNYISFYLLIPYFLWVSFAGFLNWIIAF